MKEPSSQAGCSGFCLHPDQLCGRGRFAAPVHPVLNWALCALGYSRHYIWGSHFSAEGSLKANFPVSHPLLASIFFSAEWDHETRVIVLGAGYTRMPPVTTQSLMPPCMIITCAIITFAPGSPSAFLSPLHGGRRGSRLTLRDEACKAVCSPV